MFITTLSINVGRSRANRSLVMDVFSFVDLLFVVDPPRKADGSGVVHEHVDFDLFSFVQASGVEVFVRSSLSGLFLVDLHDMVTCVIMYDVGGARKRIGGVYVPPKTDRLEWLACEAAWDGCDFLMGDFNAKHDDWNPFPRPGSIQISDCRGLWLARFCDRTGLRVQTPTGCTFRNISAIDLFVGCSETRVSYDGKAGLEHVAVIARLEVDEPADMVRRRPAWKNIPASDCDDILEHVDSGSDEGMWSRLRSGVDALPRCGRKVGRCPFWNPDLQWIRSDLNHLRRVRRRLPTVSDDYNVVRRVYRAMLLKSRQEFIKDTIGKAGDPEIFRLARQLESRRTLPSMRNPDGGLVCCHSDISDLVAAQLRPGDEQPWHPSTVEMDPACKLESAIRRSPTNTGPGLDDIGYPFIRYWLKENPECLRRLIDYGLTNDICDWHSAEVVLIPKADKPRYDIVKSWRMIHLLPTIAKVVERIVLLRIAEYVVLGHTQFGSRRKRGVHEAMSVVFEFLRHNQGFKCAMLSMDVEGGFDNIDIDLLCDFLAARECPANLILWVRRWAGNRVVRFRFNGRVSKPYFVNCGIPQGSPLSPFLFGAYVADIFEPRLRYSPSVRTVISSFVDDGVILVASDSRDLTRYTMEELFMDCDRIAKGRNMGFSAIKTKWIGFGGTAWEDLDIDGELLTPVEDLRVLGYRFNVFLNMSSHVSYWLDRGLGVRRRISALGRRFGSDGGLDAWCTYRLFQAAYLPTVYYGLEFVTDFSSYVKRIQVHVNDCLRSLFRCPLKLANNIMLAEFGTPPVHIQGRYLQRRCYSRMINYRYCDDHPWFGSIRGDWEVEGMLAYPMLSEEVATTVPSFNVSKGKELAKRLFYEAYEDAVLIPDLLMIYTDGSKCDRGTAVAWTTEECGMTEGAKAFATPPTWSIVECEIFAIIAALRDVHSDYHGMIIIFSDCIPAIMCIAQMVPEGESTGMWDVLTPLFNQFSAVRVCWIPGHCGIAGNEMSDVKAKEAVGGVLHTRNWAGVVLGLGHAIIAGELRAAEWSHWHKAEGHDYYDRSPRKPRHLRGLSRLDHYILLRIRSGTGVVGHDGCRGANDRFHLTFCDRYLVKRPRFPTLFNDKRIPEWRDWWQSHFNLGLGIPSEHEDNDGVVTVCGNPFQWTVTQLINGTLSLFHLGAPDSRCTRCLLKNCDGGDKCMLPVRFVSPGGGGRRVALTWWPDVGPCGECGSSAKIFCAHLLWFPGCALHYFVPFWYNIVHN